MRLKGALCVQPFDPAAGARGVQQCLVFGLDAGGACLGARKGGCMTLEGNGAEGRCSVPQGPNSARTLPVTSGDARSKQLLRSAARDLLLPISLKPPQTHTCYVCTTPRARWPAAPRPPSLRPYRPCAEPRPKRRAPTFACIRRWGYRYLHACALGLRAQTRSGARRLAAHSALS